MIDREASFCVWTRKLVDRRHFAEEKAANESAPPSTHRYLTLSLPRTTNYDSEQSLNRLNSPNSDGKR